jgi:hypothetical protein
MSLLMAVEAFLIRRRARLAFYLRLRAQGLIGNLFLVFALARHRMLPLFLLLWAINKWLGFFLMLSSAVLSIPYNSVTVFYMPFIWKFIMNSS